jgi:hypothetical protein
MIKDIHFTKKEAEINPSTEDLQGSFWCTIRFHPEQEDKQKTLTAIGEGSSLVKALSSALNDMNFLSTLPS